MRHYIRKRRRARREMLGEEMEGITTRDKMLEEERSLAREKL